MSENIKDKIKRREGVFLVLYQSQFVESPADELAYELFECFDAELTESDIKDISAKAAEVLSRDAEFTEIITKYSPRKKAERIPKVVMALLKLSLCEMKYLKVAPKVSIHECVELCKTYSFENDYAFLNAVLDSYRKENI